MYSNSNTKRKRERREAREKKKLKKENMKNKVFFFPNHTQPGPNPGFEKS
jgi:hypothetical protein